MADSMCGPSNALQNFQKQSTADRTLQQDRLVARTPQSQGFRSAGSIAGTVDPEFEAFQAGQLPLQHPEAQGFQPGGFQNLHAPQRINQAGPAAWANDFQRMTISPLPGLQQQGIPLSQQSQHGVAWHQEFSQMQNQRGMAADQHHNYSAPVERLSSLAAMPFGMQQPMHQSPMFPLGGQSLYNGQPQQQAQSQPQEQTDAFDEEAFARAFDQAARSELDVQLSEQASLSQDIQDSILEDRIGADAIHHPDDADYQPMTPQEENDDLSKTAGQLLNSVSDNQSEKFQNSVFLQLMRQLRDKEVVVEGDKIRPAHEPAGVLQRSNSEIVADFAESPILRPPMSETRDASLTSSTAFFHTEQYEYGETDLVLPPMEAASGLGETKKKFRNLKVQFEELHDRQERAKEELRQAALRLWEEELAHEGITWGES